MTARFIIGDSLTVLRSLPDASVDLVLSSPPFLALRSYLPADHPDKGKEIGSEPTPGAFIDTLLDITEECRRVLAPHGSLCFELGDTYSGSGGAGGDYNAEGLRDGQQKFSGSAKKRASNGKGDDYRPSRAGRLAQYADDRGNPDGMRDTTFSGANTRTGGGDGWPLDKSLCLIPESYRWALVYGRNPFTGRQTQPWRARNVVRWVRPNPPVGALGDKFRPATSDLVIACTSRTRYFDLDAVRTPLNAKTEANLRAPDSIAQTTARRRVLDNDKKPGSIDYGVNPAGGAPPLDWWSIAPAGYPGAHYAVYPPDLCVRPILAMCPHRVCTTCGEPSRRIAAPAADYLAEVDGGAGETWRHGRGGEEVGNGGIKKDGGITARFDTKGWTDCGHDTWRPGITLDPFAGSGTTLAVATGHGRSAIGIDLDERNADLARERVGMFLEVERFTGAAA